METIPFDLVRMLIGDEPVWFLAEIVLRTTIIYLYTLALLRWIGGRSISQLSVVEFLLVIALGSAVGDAAFYPDVPLLHAMVVITVVVLIDKAMDYGIRRWQGVKNLVDGMPSEIVRDGRILCDGLISRGLGTLEVMELLRREGIENLGQVRYAYIESSGALSVFRVTTALPGLPIVPPPEIRAATIPSHGQPQCCANCGATTSGTQPCPHCGKSERALKSTAMQEGNTA